jgi:hypothetical protein
MQGRLIAALVGAVVVILFTLTSTAAPVRRPGFRTSLNPGYGLSPELELRLSAAGGRGMAAQQSTTEHLLEARQLARSDRDVLRTELLAVSDKLDEANEVCELS